MLKGTASRDWIGPYKYKVLIEQAHVSPLSRGFSDFLMASSLLNSDNFSCIVLACKKLAAFHAIGR
jgi:hypothetical protein